MDEKESEVEELERMFTNESAEPIRISYSVIQSITKNFCQVIGYGGFGIVYLGALRNDAMVAVKQLNISKDFSDTQFLTEVKCLKRVKHKNIVKFLGYCAFTDGIVMKVNGEDKLVDVPKRFLCFEYAPNGNLHDYLKVMSAEKTHGYEWSVCYKIIRGICHGLQNLHQNRIYHLDLKPANVLLGAQMEPKIADFGSSRCTDGTQSTIVTRTLNGTFGYMAPELINNGTISSRSDIFSLGFIMIRLLTRNENTTENWHESLTVHCEQMDRCIKIARVCAEEDPSKRPKISEIICMLNETKTTMENIPPITMTETEPRNDQTSKLYKIVQRFRTLPAQTPGEYHRGPEKLPVERPKWKLAFQMPPKLPIILGEKIEDANGNPLEVILVDADTGKSSALPNVLQIELVPLLGNFPRDYWDSDDFQRGIVEDLEKKLPLLAGEYRFTMWDGCTTVNKLMFTNNSLKKCDRMFRIGVRVVPGSYRGARILEAMTEAFMVRDRQTYELHYKNGLKWQLAFQSQPRLPIYVGQKITDIIGNPLEVILVDTKTGSPSTLPMELHIQLVTLIESRLPSSKYWSANEFQKAVLNWREEFLYWEPLFSGPLLFGDVSLTMKDDGRVIVSDLQFTEDPMKDVCIGVCVVSGGYNGPNRILEGMSHFFKVEADTTSNYTKHYPPALNDEVWRLNWISWGGEFHKRLEQNGIRNVQDFLMMLAAKPEELRAVSFLATAFEPRSYILSCCAADSICDCSSVLFLCRVNTQIMGDNMEDYNSTPDRIIEHVMTCVFPRDKVYTYGAAEATIYVNSIFDLIKVKFGGMECPLQQLDDAQKRLVQQVMQEAYEHRHSLQEVKITLKLVFKRPPQLPIHAGSRITDATGNPLEIILVDAKTGSLWALPMYLDIHLVPLLGDFPLHDEDWTAEEFQRAIVKQRQENVPLLKSDISSERSVFIMRYGHVTIDELLQFTDDSSWVRCRKFCIGAYVKPGGRYDGSFRIIEAMTEAFVVGDVNRKHYPPVPGDPVWRLEMIDKDGPVHRELASNNVDTVQEFLRMYNVKPDELRAIVGDGMTDRMQHMMVLHAFTCTRGDKVYAYSGANGTIFVDSVLGRLFKVEIDGVECPLEQLLNNAQMVFVKQLILEAYEHRNNLQEVGAAMELRDDTTINIFDLSLGADLMTMTTWRRRRTSWRRRRSTMTTRMTMMT